MDIRIHIFIRVLWISQKHIFYKGYVCDYQKNIFKLDSSGSQIIEIISYL